MVPSRWLQEGCTFEFNEQVLEKINIGWPQQPLKEKVLKFYMTFHDSTTKNAEFKNLADSEVSRVILQTLGPQQPQQPQWPQ